MKRFIAEAPKFELYVLGHSFVRRWVQACLAYSTYGTSSPLRPLEMAEALSETLITEEVAQTGFSTSPILSHIKCDNKISKIHVVSSKKLNLVLHLAKYGDLINLNPNVKMLIVDVFSNSIANLSDIPSAAPGYDMSIDAPLTALFEEFRKFILDLRPDIVVIAFTVAPRLKGLLPKIRPSPYQKRNSYTPQEYMAAQRRFEQRRLAVNATLLQMDQQARLGQSPSNFRLHRITCWPVNNTSAWMDSDDIHPTPEQLRLNYSAHIKKAVLDPKNRPVIHQLLTRFNKS